MMKERTKTLVHKAECLLDKVKQFRTSLTEFQQLKQQQVEWLEEHQGAAFPRQWEVDMWGTKTEVAEKECEECVLEVAAALSQFGVYTV